jgi:hypothetical protein
MRNTINDATETFKLKTFTTPRGTYGKAGNRRQRRDDDNVSCSDPSSKCIDSSELAERGFNHAPEVRSLFVTLLSGEALKCNH